jgi:hypothetical protein
MLPIRKYLKPYRDAGAANACIPVHRFVDEHAFLTKSGTLGLALSIGGVSPECLTDETLNGISARLRNALSAFDESFRLYQYVIKQDGARLPASEQYPSQAVAEAVRQRNSALKDRGLYSVELFLVILYEPAIFGKHKLSNRNALRMLAAELARNTDTLTRRVESFVRETADLLSARILPKAEVFTFLRTLANLRPEVARALPLMHDSHVDYFVPEQHLNVHRDGVQVGDEYLEVLTLKDPPRHTRPDLFRELCAMPANFILCTEYKPISKHESVDQVAKAESHFNRMQWLKNPWSLVTVAMNKFMGESDDRRDIVSDKAALSNVEELGKISIALNQGDVLGQFSTSIVFHGPNKRQLRDLASRAVTLLSNFEASCFVETYNTTPSTPIYRSSPATKRSTCGRFGCSPRTTQTWR